MQIPKIGDVVAGRYELTGELGRGGFGIVFKATQLGMNRPVALKVLLPQAATVDTVTDRFTREAQLAKNLVHPNTIQLYDFGETESGCLFIAMEYLEGETLDKLLKREGQLPIDRTIAIAGQMLKSLAEAHEHGIVHRDLKPANIFLRQLVGEKDFVKVLDFGIAKALNLDGVEDEKLTQTGSSFGTPSYMAPEQIRGINLGPHTDLYAVALIILKMLTGKTAVEGGTPIETAALQLSVHDVPVPDWIGQTPLGPVLRKALHKDIGARYAHAIDMLQDMQRAAASIRGDLVGPAAGAAPGGLTPVTGQLLHSGQISYSMSGPVPLPPPLQPRSNALIIVLAVLALLLIGGAATAVILSSQAGNVPSDGNAEAQPNPAPTPPVAPAADATAVAPAPVATNTNTPTPAPVDEVSEPLPIVEVPVDSEPAGAIVHEGDKILGTTPFLAAFEGETGVRRITISGPGFVAQQVDIDLAAPKAVKVTLDRVDAIAVVDPTTNPSDQPKSDAPNPTDKPKDDKPKTDKPKTDKPKTDKPKDDKPKTDPDPKTDKKPAIPLPEDEKPKTDDKKVIPMPD